MIHRNNKSYKKTLRHRYKKIKQKSKKLIKRDKIKKRHIAKNNIKCIKRKTKKKYLVVTF